MWTTWQNPLIKIWISLLPLFIVSPSGTVAAGLATAGCIMGILSLPLILLLVYKQRQTGHSSRRKQLCPSKHMHCNICLIVTAVLIMYCSVNYGDQTGIVLVHVTICVHQLV